MADDTKPWLTEGFSLGYNPFYANKAYYGQYGGALNQFGQRTGAPDFYQDPESGQWMQRVPVTYNMGDSEYTDYQYQAVPEGFDPSTATYSDVGGDTNPNQLPVIAGRDFGVNLNAVQENSPDIYANWSVTDKGNFLRDAAGPTQFMVVGYDEKTGGYITLSKTGDKEGTLQLWTPTENGGMQVAKNLGTVPWDTNIDVPDQSAFQVAKVASGPLQFYAGQQISQLASEAFNAYAPEWMKAAWEGAKAAGETFEKFLEGVNSSVQEWAQQALPGGTGTVPSTTATGGGFTGNMSDFAPGESPVSIDQTWPTQPGDLGDWPTSDLTGSMTDFEYFGDPAGPNTPPTPPGADDVLDPFEVTGTRPTPEFPVPPINTTTPNPGNPDYSLDDSPNDAQDPANDNPDNTDEPPYVPREKTVIEKIADALGMDMDTVKALFPWLTGAAAALFNGGDQTITVKGDPDQIAARKDLLGYVTGQNLADRVARDRALSNTMMGWADKAAAVPGMMSAPDRWLYNKNGMMTFNVPTSTKV